MIGKPPTQCALWRDPHLVDRSHQNALFEVVEVFVDESHLSRELVRCRECGQLYFYEFFEDIDFVNGEDPTYTTYIPIETSADANKLKGNSQMALMSFSPRIQKDFPSYAKVPNPAVWRL